MKKIFLIIIISSVTTFSQSAGNTGLSFLKIGFGARNIAMGDAGVAASNDVTSLFYNPANLAGQQGTEILAMHNEWIQDVRSEIIGARFMLFDVPFAIGFNVTSVNDIEVRTRPGSVESTFDASYFFGSLSTGFRIVENISFGASAKYLYESIFVDDSRGYAFDFGLNYKTPVEGLLASAVVRNLGSMNQLRSEETKLPAELRVGPAYSFNLENSKFGFTGAAELQKYFEEDNIHFNFGAEVVYDDIIALRGGYRTGFESKSFTAGLGLKWGGLSFDYAFQPFSYGLGSANIFSVQFKF